MREDSVASKDNVQNAQDSQAGAMPRGAGTDGLNRLDNPYYPAFDLLLARLLAHEEVLGLVTHMIPSDDEGGPGLAARIDADPMANPPQGFLADICEMRNDGYVRHFPTFRLWHATKESRLHVKQTFRRRCCGWIVAQAYESFREFVEDVDQAIPKPQSVRERLLGHAYAWIPLARKRTDNRRGLKSALKRIREAAPALHKCEIWNSRGVNLSSWLGVLASVRHAIVHSDGIIAERRWRRLRSAGLERSYPGEHVPKVGYVLDLTPEVAQDTIERLREYGLAIYKAVSADVGCPVTLYDHDKGIAVWRR